MTLLKRRCSLVIAWLLTAISVVSIGQANDRHQDRPPLRVSAKVLTGGTPITGDAFDQLKDAGVETLVSVDAARPNQTAARQSGLEYVHLPIGYDGISDRRLLELAKLVHDCPGQVFVHCHHGKHRGPAAAAAACVVAGQIDQTTARQILRRAGTSELYGGLCRAVHEATAVPPGQLDQIEVQFRSYEAPSSLANQMLDLDIAWRRAKRSGVREFPAARQLVVQHYRELIRAGDTTDTWSTDDQTDAMRLLRRGVQAAQEIRWGDERSFQVLQANCNTCHDRFRN